jgi:hypothetical protein
MVRAQARTLRRRLVAAIAPAVYLIGPRWRIGSASCPALAPAVAEVNERKEESMDEQAEIGPVDYMIVAFPGNEFRGEIAPALAKLVEAGTIRIIDLAFVGKDADGEVAAFELSDLDPEVREGLENLGAEVSGLLNEDDLMATAEELEPNSSAALLVWENVWARETAQAMRDAGGELYDFARLPHEVVQAAREYALANA